MPPFPRPQHSSSPTAGLHLPAGQQAARRQAKGRQNALARARCPPAASLGTPSPAAGPPPQQTAVPGTQRGWQGIPRGGSLSAAAGSRFSQGEGMCVDTCLCSAHVHASSVMCTLPQWANRHGAAISPAGSSTHPPLLCWLHRAAESSGHGPELPLGLTGRGQVRRERRLRGCDNKQAGKQAGWVGGGEGKVQTLRCGGSWRNGSVAQGGSAVQHSAARTYF